LHWGASYRLKPLTTAQSWRRLAQNWRAIYCPRRLGHGCSRLPTATSPRLEFKGCFERQLGIGRPGLKPPSWPAPRPKRMPEQVSATKRARSVPAARPIHVPIHAAQIGGCRCARAWHRPDGRHPPPSAQPLSKLAGERFRSAARGYPGRTSR
jgi:hypothetical protein